MITALDNTSTLTGPGATTGQSARIRTFELDGTASGTSAQAEASAVVSLSAQATRLAASESAAPSTAAAASAPATSGVTSGAATAASTSAPTASTPAPTAKASTASTASSPAATSTTAPATASSASSGKPVTLVPNLVYDPADTDQNGVVSPTERRSYDVVHDAVPRPASATDHPPRRVVDAELREYTAIANTRG
ncbi:hypothetical protein CDN99_14445 [Roseateles aquatilis]|uniref:Uncharacterized protein n=1 Tax=Roseateles aquatilis TaxID=431061 RepID=A0A246J825_9BURK|nr:hypothetical protein [Roseateles aquatilis]OWQ88692.1 hypothetical protein CDN99_14445 [Roseateles aquatilis]